MTEKTKKSHDVTIAKAKGRPMLTWVGKKPLARVTAFPAQAIERFELPAPADKNAAGSADCDWSDWPRNLPQGGLLYHGDNKDVLAHLLANGFRGKVKLIYIDPPFDSGADYVRKVQLRGAKGTVKIDGEDYTLGEQVQYSDIWANDNYLQFMYQRIQILYSLLSDDGVLCLHCDHNVSYMLRCVLDEIFGRDRFINEVIWQHAVIGAGRGIYVRLPKAHETILIYSKGDKYTFNTDEKDVRVPYKDRITENLQQDEKGWYYTRGRTGTDNPWSKDPRYLRTYVDIEKGKLVHDSWDDITTYRAQGDEYAGYPTQKPEQLVRRFISLLSSSGDLILDCFIGSGTTAAIAQKLGRRWIGCDINKGAIQTTAKRLQGVIEQQRDALEAKGKQRKLVADEAAAPAPCQFGFTTWRVNDYDLQIQHNEAVELACQHLGVTRTRTDAYFDGTQGGRLVKIVPFNHPLTPLDLEALRAELKTRPDEERDILIVSLGIQQDAQQWVDDYNRNRPVNRLHVIELRTDGKYGGFIKHEPMSAEVSVSREGDQLIVDIRDVLSPTILQRLNLDQGVFRASIPDWRAVVDCVLIDSRYNGELFNVALSDVPERKQDFVMGRYELPAPPSGSRVAVKIIDMLGEELLLTFDV
ncbi:site-specific DNA-methyltransferase [Thiobacillus sedimenti]|uniref:Site-specific DNA-methyltransferase n=1 Tax=Thiobacillus sedimenti TaxID=3110231 RepID=A0ABZ1CMS9_9PROT|nr:site-specific DNA-methyltransferase [Thiobacillus sp. SCUT-2]WRS40504.1 site-specific DNA-methyltransferase [Thiobacillus sp. SCUT-2]